MNFCHFSWVRCIDSQFSLSHLIYTFWNLFMVNIHQMPLSLSLSLRITKPRALLSSSLMKYSFPINRKVLHFKRLNRMLLENSFQLVKLKNWKNSKERIFSWHLSFDFHLDKFPFAPRTCLRILFFWYRKRSVDSHVWLCYTSSLTQIVCSIVLTGGDGLILADTFAVMDYTRNVDIMLFSFIILCISCLC